MPCWVVCAALLQLLCSTAALNKPYVCYRTRLQHNHTPYPRTMSCCYVQL